MQPFEGGSGLEFPYAWPPDQVRHRGARAGEEVINFRNAWCVRVCGCEFEETRLCFVLGVQGVVAVKFHEEALDEVYRVCNLSPRLCVQQVRSLVQRILLWTTLRGFLDEELSKSKGENKSICMVGTREVTC